MLSKPGRTTLHSIFITTHDVIAPHQNKPVTTVHILTPGLTSPTGIGFLFPILYHRKALRSAGVECRLFDKVEPKLTDCDVLIVDSKYHRDSWAARLPQTLEWIQSTKEAVDRLLWFDTTDSTGTLQTAVLPLVDRYYKNQLLKDRSNYKTAFYGMRIFTDFYHRQFAIEDDEPAYSEPPSDDDLTKLDVSWNCSLIDLSLWGPRRASLFRRLGWKFLLRQPTRWVEPSTDRNIKLSTRFTANHRRATVRFQREKVREVLDNQISTNFLSRSAYVRELEHSQAVIAPFSYGETTWRDFEVFIAGCLLIKPDMGHMQTWPDLYQDGVTYVSYDWSVEHLADLLEQVAARYEEYLPIARSGQANYRNALIGDDAREAFVTRFADIVQSG